jgi:hypothetical protein
MNNNLKITCPKCKSIFDAGDAFNAHFESAQTEAKKQAEKDAEEKYKLKIEKQHEEIQAVKKAESKKAAEEADKKIKTFIEQFEKEKIKAQKEAEAQAKIKAEKDKEIFIKSFQEEQKKKLEKQIKDDLEQRSKKEELNKDKQIKELKEKNEKIQKEREIENERNKKQIEELVSLNNKTKSEIKGEVQEELIQDFLIRKFPEDIIQEVKKGARGPDCIFTINYKGSKDIGKIYIESKDTKSWNEEWVTKLFNDMQIQGADNGIIVSTCLPKDFDENSGFVNRQSNTITIIKMDYSSIHITVSLIKSLLIYKQRNASSTNLPEEIMRVWENVKSPNFQMPVRSMVNQIESFKKIFNKDAKDFNNSLANKERTLKQLENDLIRMISSFTKSAGEIFPQDLLSYKDDYLLEEGLSSKVIIKKEDVNKKKEILIKSDLSEDFLNIIKINIHKEWSLSMRTLSALKDLDIIYVGDLISYDKIDLLKIRNFGNKSLEEITEYMATYNLSFGTNIKDWSLIRLSLSETKE